MWSNTCATFHPVVADRLQGLQRRPSPPSAIYNALIWLNLVFSGRTKGAGAHRRLIACRYLRVKGSGLVDRRTPLLIRHRIVSRVIPASKGISGSQVGGGGGGGGGGAGGAAPLLLPAAVDFRPAVEALSTKSPRLQAGTSGRLPPWHRTLPPLCCTGPTPAAGAAAHPSSHGRRRRQRAGARLVLQRKVWRRGERPWRRGRQGASGGRCASAVAAVPFVPHAASHFRQPRLSASVPMSPEHPCVLSQFSQPESLPHLILHCTAEEGRYAGAGPREDADAGGGGGGGGGSDEDGYDAGPSAVNSGRHADDDAAAVAALLEGTPAGACFSRQKSGLSAS
jgi:hypothetical protein